MGLDTSHNCWHGAYSAFMRWREKIAEVAGLPPLMLMEGYYTENAAGDPLYGIDLFGAEHLRKRLPIRWDSLKPDPLHILLTHSDCDGEIAWRDCKPIADRLTELLPLLEGDGGGHIGDYRAKTQQFIDGLRLAHKKKQNVDFH
jgi:hypothetical protein